MSKRGFLFQNLRGDLFGGITAGIVALPLALAFGVQSGLGAAAGLYGAIILGILASLFGGTPAQISGPTGPMTVVSASLVAMGITNYGTSENALGLILITFALAGLFQILFGVLKIGKYIRYIPYPVLSGFMSGIGLIIIILQVFPLAGLKSPAKITDVFLQIGEAIPLINYQSLAIGLVTIFLIYTVPLITKKIPGTLIALVVMTLASVLMGLTVPCIGEIPSGLPKLQIMEMFSVNWSDILLIIGPAVSLAGLGAIDTLLTSVVADNITNTKHSSNRELIGQGIGNFTASLFGGIPGAGATMRTVVNVRSGGRTPLSGVIHGLLLILILLGLGRWVALIPNSVLAGILITVGISIIDRKGLADLIHIPKADAFVLLVVLLLTVFVDLLQAVGVGMVIASVLFMKRASDLVDSGTHAEPIKLTDKEIPWDDEQGISSELLSQIYIQRLDGPVFFGAVTAFQQKMNSIPDGVRVVIIRMRKVPFLDQSGLYAMESSIKDLKNKGVQIAVTMIQPQPLYMFQKANLVPGLIPNELVFPSFTDCAEWLKTTFEVGS